MLSFILESLKLLIIILLCLNSSYLLSFFCIQKVEDLNALLVCFTSSFSFQFSFLHTALTLSCLISSLSNLISSSSMLSSMTASKGLMKIDDSFSFLSLFASCPEMVFWSTFSELSLVMSSSCSSTTSIISLFACWIRNRAVWVSLLYRKTCLASLFLIIANFTFKFYDFYIKPIGLK